MIRRILLEKFHSQAKTARKSVHDSFSRKLDDCLDDSVLQQQLLPELVDTFMQAMRAMGDYQRKSIDFQKAESREEITRRLNELLAPNDEMLVAPLETVEAFPAVSAENLELEAGN